MERGELTQKYFFEVYGEDSRIPIRFHHGLDSVVWHPGDYEGTEDDRHNPWSDIYEATNFDEFVHLVVGSWNLRSASSMTAVHTPDQVTNMGPFAELLHSEPDLTDVVAYILRHTPEPYGVRQKATEAGKKLNPYRPDTLIERLTEVDEHAAELFIEALKRPTPDYVEADDRAIFDPHYRECGRMYVPDRDGAHLDMMFGKRAIRTVKGFPRDLSVDYVELPSIAVKNQTGFRDTVFRVVTKFPGQYTIQVRFRETSHKGGTHYGEGRIELLYEERVSPLVNLPMRGMALDDDEAISDQMQDTAGYFLRELEKDARIIVNDVSCKTTDNGAIATFEVRKRSDEKAQAETYPSAAQCRRDLVEEATGYFPGLKDRPDVALAALNGEPL